MILPDDATAGTLVGRAWIPAAAGSIAGPVIAAQLISRHWSSEGMFLIAAVPAALSALLIWGLASKERAHPARPCDSRAASRG